MLSARGEDVDRIAGLELGADDYLAKPFNPRELVARIGAILRRTGSGGPIDAVDRPAERLVLEDVEMDRKKLGLRPDSGERIRSLRAVGYLYARET